MFKRYQQIHFVGIGGVGMSGIAEILLNLGYRVTGSDQRRNETVERLEQLGAKVYVGHDASHLEGAHVVVYLAAFLAKRRDALGGLRHGLLTPLAVAGALAALVLAQPDLGNCLTLLALTFSLLFLAGVRPLHLALVLAPAVPLLALVIWAAPYRLRRITAFMDPWADPRGSGFQIIQSWLALGNGGLLGQGIGGSALLVTMLATGVLLNISQQADV